MRGKMRALNRNKVLFYYALRDWDTVEEDEYGNQKISYLKPQPFRANMSPANGETAIEQFGYNIKYDKVIVTCDMSCPIDEDSVIISERLDDLLRWSDISADMLEKFSEEEWKELAFSKLYSPEGDLLYDYVVKRVSPSLNCIAYAIEKVKVS